MALEDYRRVTIKSDYANEPIDPIRLSAGDDNGRILRFVLKNGGESVPSTGLSCRFLIDQGAGLYQDLTAVSGTTTATWEAPLPMGGVSAGQHVGTIEVTDANNHVVCCRNFSVIVEMGIFANGEQSESMQDALTEFEQRTNAALEANADAVEDAETAASAANTAAGLANQAYNTAQQAVAELASYVPISAGNILTATVGGTGVDTADDAFAGPVTGFTIYGNSTQDGTPTPSAPVAIKSVAECDLMTAGANLLPEIATQTKNGVTITNNGDGSYTLNGTATATVFFEGAYSKPLPYGTYTGGGDAVTPSGVDIALRMGGDPNTVFLASSRSQYTFSIAQDYDYWTIRIGSGAVISNLTIKPRLCAGSTLLPHVKYQTPTTTPLIPSTVGPLRSLPDGTRDVLRVMRDGSGVIERWVEKIAVTSGYFSFNAANYYPGYSRFVHYTKNDPYVFSTYTNRKTGSILSTFGSWSMSPIGGTGSTADGDIENYGSGGAVYLYLMLNGTTFQDQASFNSWITEHPQVIYIARTTPTTETIPATAMPALLSRYLTAWADGSDEDGAAIEVEWEMEYERSLQVVIDQIEQAIADI